MTQDPVKAKIQELVPDIMELKTGCEITFQGIPGIFYEFREDGKISASTFSNVNPEELDKGGILGSPITLSVVLRAMKKMGVDVAISCDGHILTKGHDLRGEYLGYCWSDFAEWNLTKDNYDDQTQETKDFIGELLDIRNKD